ncbi:hypothetical protein BKA56DRAFT_623553 [Ilyonectria sp. MPI-CAGE-AT-0026]|nr:hypothetical protein BKA56DRAFT_623553 [Ilyonectria sp. MPI-CAGE-AT-0026]
MLSPSEFAKLMRETPTDKETIETFTPQEAEFHRWRVTNRTVELDLTNRDWVQETWPNVENAYEKWMIYYKKWDHRPYSNWDTKYAISEDDYIDLVCSMPRNNHEQYDKAVKVEFCCDTRAIKLGESSFGGALTGYIVNIGWSCLLAKFHAHGDPEPRYHRICSIDLDRPRYRYSTKDLGSFIQGTDITDFLDRDVFCFWEIGELKCCGGNTWKDISKGGVANTNPNPSLRPDFDLWDWTDYVVVIQLDPSGCPSGGVYVVHVKEKKDNTRWGSPETRFELPGPLDRWSKPPFFMAKIADKFQDLKKTRQFDFEVIFKEIQDVVPVKFAGTPQRLIPRCTIKWYPPLSLSNVEE